MHRIPGGLGIANVFACALFAAMAGSSPATCSAIGSAGIPEMRKRGYSGGFAAGIIAAGGTLGILLPPSITMILYAVAAEQSLGRLFLAGIGPGAAAGRAVRRLCRVSASARNMPRPRRSTRTAARIGHPRTTTTITLGAEASRAAARAALRPAADRRDGRALRRLRHAVGDRGPRRHPGAGADRADLQHLAAQRSRADPGHHDPRIRPC